jgi:hypothetical protein
MIDKLMIIGIYAFFALSLLFFCFWLAKRK